MTQNTNEANRLITTIVARGLGAGQEIDQLIELLPASHWTIVELAGEIEHNQNLGINANDIRRWISEIRPLVGVPDTIVDIVRAASAARESVRLLGLDTKPNDDLLASKREVFESGAGAAGRHAADADDLMSSGSPRRSGGFRVCRQFPRVRGCDLLTPPCMLDT